MAFPSQPPPLHGVVHTDVRVDRNRWHVAVAGDPEAPPLLLLHGWPQHWWMWRRVIGPLAADFRVYAPDLRGFGWSDAPAGNYSKMGLAHDVERLLDVLEIDRCVVGGARLGRLRRLAACDPGPGARRAPGGHEHHQPVVEARAHGRRDRERLVPAAGDDARTPTACSVPRFVRLMRRAVEARGGAPRTPGCSPTAGAARSTRGPARRSTARSLAASCPPSMRGRYDNRRVDLPGGATRRASRDPVVTPERHARRGGLRRRPDAPWSSRTPATSSPRRSRSASSS